MWSDPNGLKKRIKQRLKGSNPSFTVWLDRRSSDMVFSRPFAALTQVRKVRQVKPEKKI
jgi:hypothetical protein